MNIDRRTFVQAVAAAPLVGSAVAEGKATYQPPVFDDKTGLLHDEMVKLQKKHLTPEWQANLNRPQPNIADKIIIPVRNMFSEIGELSRQGTWGRCSASSRVSFYSGKYQMGTCWCNRAFKLDSDDLIPEEDCDFPLPVRYFGGSYFTPMLKYFSVRPIEQAVLYVDFCDAMDDPTQRFGIAIKRYLTRWLFTGTVSDFVVKAAEKPLESLNLGDDD